MSDSRVSRYLVAPLCHNRRACRRAKKNKKTKKKSSTEALSPELLLVEAYAVVAVGAVCGTSRWARRLRQ